ncbi:hypothetical protein AC1031_005923 [Aphanomyces cochlioides]|nr:hypothetical protein AC1031_005923 [Aphanomyces cochlioides]
MVPLYNLTLPTAENSYLYQSLNWTLFDTPLQGCLISCRDISYVEHQEVVEIEGRKAYILSMTSTEIPGVDDLEHKYGIVRGKLLHSGFLFIETDRPGVLEFLSTHHNRPNGNGNGAMGKFILRKAVMGYCQVVLDLGRVIRAHQLS